MKMANIYIDFNKLVKDGGKILFAGRDNGRKAYSFFGIDRFTLDNNDRIFLSIPNGVVVSSSYFLGMLENILPLFSSPNEFYSRTSLDGVNYKEGMLSELDRAVRRGLHRNVPFF